MTWGNQNSQEEAFAQMDYALDKGVSFWDTAELYAVPASPETSFKTEIIIGNWFKKTGRRDEVILASKIAGPGPYTKHIREASDYSIPNIKEAVEGSLKRLQTDYIDLYQIHWPARRTNFFGVRGYKHHPAWEDNILTVIEGLEEAIKEGKIRHFGISNETPWGLMSYLKYAAALGKPRCVSVQNPYNLLNRTYEIGMAEMSIREKCGLLAYSPMAFGVLSGKYHLNKPPSKGRLIDFPGQMERYSSKISFEATRRYKEIAEKNGLSLAQMSLAFVTQQPFMTSNIIGATSLEQLKENIDSADLILSKEILNEIEEIHNEIPNPAP
jgi:aryl-alcohol dehydrogenase-like predicted oxidoreductase